MGGQLASFVAVAVLVIVLPGQDTALTIRNTLLGGRRAGRLTAAGISSGQAIWAVATAAGVAAVLHASEPAFLALKVAGAAYLAAEVVHGRCSRRQSPYPWHDWPLVVLLRPQSVPMSLQSVA